MKIVYVDDQTSFVQVVREATQLLEKAIGIKVDFEFVTVGEDASDTLVLDDRGKQIPDEGVPEYQAIPARPLFDAANRSDTLFLLDVKFPDCDFYGVRLAKYLVTNHNVDTGRILLFTQYRDVIRDEEQRRPRQHFWFKYYSKDEFENRTTGSTRLANDLEGRLRAITKTRARENGGSLRRDLFWWASLKRGYP